MKVGILGGSGIYDLEGMEAIERREMQTPFGSPSDAYILGKLGGREVCFLPRHGKGHKLMPSEINHRANICGLKTLGVDRVVSISAVGSLKENIHPRDIVLPDQYFDRTKKSLEHTFFGDGIVGHISFADPACGALREAVAAAARGVIAGRPEQAKANVTEGGTYVNMEGPAFSTRSESNAYRSFGFDVIGMTSLPEAKLCREAEMCYQAMAMVTDYDCWHEEESPVNVEMVIEHLIANTALARAIVAQLVADMPEQLECECSSALANAIITDKDAIPGRVREVRSAIFGKYL